MIPRTDALPHGLPTIIDVLAELGHMWDEIEEKKTASSVQSLAENTEPAEDDAHPTTEGQP